jgi:hypothetical protein
MLLPCWNSLGELTATRRLQPGLLFLSEDGRRVGCTREVQSLFESKPLSRCEMNGTPELSSLCVSGQSHSAPSDFQLQTGQYTCLALLYE